MLKLAVQFLIIWSQTTIQVPLKANIENYKYLPEATMMENGIKQNDLKMYYEYEINRTFFSVVNTNHVGSYRVDYKVYFPTYNKTSEQTIIFEVIDDVAPEIIAASDIHIPLGEKKYDLTRGLIYQDNYDEKAMLVLDILGAESVNYNKVGKYVITYQVMDQAKNTATKAVNVFVKDMTAPTIKQEKSVVLQPGQMFHYEDFFLIEDNYDKVFEVLIEDKNVSYQNTGTYEAWIHVKDQSGNATSVRFQVIISNKNLPQMILKKSLIFEVFDVDPYWFDYLAFENPNDEKLYTVKFNSKINMQVVNTYTLDIEITDLSNQKYKQTFKVEVKDTKPPVIKQENDIVILDFKRPDFTKYFTVKDAYDKHAYLTFDDTKVDYQQVGIYQLKVSALDLSLNQTDMEVHVLVKDLTQPVLKLTTDALYLNVFDDHMPVFDDYIDLVYDAYDTKLKKEDVIISHLIDLNKVDRYEVLFSLVDKSENHASATLIVYVQDKEGPILTIQDINLTVGSPFIYLNYMTAFDNYDGDITHKIIQATPDFNTDSKGHYELTFMVTDNQGNSTVKKAFVHVLPKSSIPIYFWIIAGGIITSTLGIFIYFKYKNKSTSF